jgi:hypothetical protein
MDAQIIFEKRVGLSVIHAGDNNLLIRRPEDVFYERNGSCPWEKRNRQREYILVRRRRTSDEVIYSFNSTAGKTGRVSRRALDHIIP